MKNEKKISLTKKYKGDPLKAEPRQFSWKFKMGRLLAQQDPSMKSRYAVEKLNYEKEVKRERIEGVEENTGDLVKVARQNKIGARKTTISMNILWRHVVKDGIILVPLGGSYGIIKREMRRVARSWGKRGFSLIPSLDLIRVEPEFVAVGKAPPECSPDGSKLPIFILEVRNVNHPPFRTREPTYYEAIENRDAEVIILVSQTCPMKTIELKELVRAVTDLDGFGAGKRGFITETTAFKKLS